MSSPPISPISIEWQLPHSQRQKPDPALGEIDAIDPGKHNERTPVPARGTSQRSLAARRTAVSSSGLDGLIAVPTRAHDLLASVYEWFTAGDLKAAKALSKHLRKISEMQNWL
jgi:hypothetical protein